MSRLRDVVVAGHTGDETTARAGADDPDPGVRAASLGALERLGLLTADLVAAGLADPDPTVRRRAAELAAGHPDVDLLGALADPDDRVVEVAAWACGEHEENHDPIVARLVDLAAGADDALVREAAVAALGALGDDRAVAVIVDAALHDRPAVRRRAVLALAPFSGADVDAAIETALGDRDWQVRQAAEDLRRAERD